jgi:hypothetical protein
MFGLVEADFACAREVDGCNRPPACFSDGAASNALCFEFRHGGDEIVTHEVEFVAGWFGRFGGMNGKFSRRQGEDQPAMAGVDGTEAQDVSKEGADLFSIMGMDEGVESVDHVANLPLINTDSTDSFRSGLLNCTDVEIWTTPGETQQRSTIFCGRAGHWAGEPISSDRVVGCDREGI